MPNEQLLTIIVSVGGLILTSTIAIVGLNRAQFRAIRSELREAARERAALRDHWGGSRADWTNSGNSFFAPVATPRNFRRSKR